MLVLHYHERAALVLGTGILCLLGGMGLLALLIDLGGMVRSVEQTT